MGFTENEVAKNMEVLKKILLLMESEGITVNQAEAISEMLSYEFTKNRKLLGTTQKFTVFRS